MVIFIIYSIRITLSHLLSCQLYKSLLHTEYLKNKRNPFLVILLHGICYVMLVLARGASYEQVGEDDFILSHEGSWIYLRSNEYEQNIQLLQS